MILGPGLAMQPIFSQDNTELDSLLNVAQEQTDTTRINTLYLIFNKQVRQEPHKAKPYVDSLLAASNSTGYKKFMALAYKAEGLYHYYNSDYTKAELSYSKSIAIYKDIDAMIPLSRMYNNLGIVQKYLGRLHESKESHLNSLRIKEKLDLGPSDIAASLVNLGVLEWELGNRELSSDYYLRAEKICAENNLTRGLNLVRGNLAGNFKDAKRYTDALKYYNLVYDYYKENNDYRGIARITNSIGALYFSMDSIQKAKSFYLEAHELNKQHDIQQMLGLTSRNLGKVAMKEKEYKKALNYFLDANIISQKTGTNTRNVGDYLNIAEAYAAIGDYKNAYKNREIHFNKYDSVFSEQKINQINELEIQYQTEKKEAALALQDAEIKTLSEKAKNDKLKKGLYAGGMVSALALSGLLFFGFRQRMKKNRIARAKQEAIYKQEIEHKKKELASQTLHLVQKSKFIAELKDNLEKVKNSPEKFKVEFKRIVMLLKKQSAADKDWEVFKSYFSEVHENFEDQLKALCNKITDKELRLASYVKMGLNNNEIADILNVLPSSIHTSKYRLKQKLNIDKDLDFDSFIKSL